MIKGGFILRQTFHLSEGFDVLSVGTFAISFEYK